MTLSSSSAPTSWSRSINPISRRIYSWVTSKSCSGALDTERAVVESRRFVMISPPDETRRRCISDRVPFPILKPVPRCGTIVENGGQTLRGDKPLFLGCNSLGHDALGASTPPEQRVVPSPQPVAVTLRAGCHRATVVSMRDHVPAKCEAAHTSFPFSPSKVQQGDIYLARQEGSHGTKTQTYSVRIYGRDGSCNGVDYPSGHDVGGPRFGCAELVSDVPSSTSAFVVRCAQAAPRIERRARLAHAYD